MTTGYLQLNVHLILVDDIGLIELPSNLRQSAWSLTAKVMVTLKISSIVPACARHCPVVGKHPNLNHVWLVVARIALPALVVIEPLCACPACLAPLINLQQSFRFSRSVIVGQSIQVLLVALRHLLGAARATFVNCITPLGD